MRGVTQTCMVASSIVLCAIIIIIKMQCTLCIFIAQVLQLHRHCFDEELHLFVTVASCWSPACFELSETPTRRSSRRHPLTMHICYVPIVRRYSVIISTIVHISVAVDMRTLLERKNFSFSSNGQVAAHRVTELISKRLCYNSRNQALAVATRLQTSPRRTSFHVGRAMTTVMTSPRASVRA